MQYVIESKLSAFGCK